VKRAGGLNPYAYPRGATLIRRNEFYENKSEDELKIETLRDVKNNFDRDSLNRTEFDKLFLERVDRKISENDEEERTKKIEILAEDYKRQSILDLTNPADTLGKMQIKDTELIGIDLQSILDNPSSPEDLILREGDVLSIPAGGNITNYSGAQILISHLDYPANTGTTTDANPTSRQTTIAYDADSKRIPIRSNDRLGVYLCSNSDSAPTNFAFTLTAYFVRS
jgi:hypothetical protein